MDEYDENSIKIITIAEGIRKRPQMYIGSTDFVGFVAYLTCPIGLLLEHLPTRIAISARGGGYIVESDVAVPIKESPAGDLAPFEDYLGLGHTEGAILNALSERLMVEIQREGRVTALNFRRGIRESRAEADGGSNGPKTTLEFVPDASILSVTELSPAVFKSYLRRLSFLHRGVRFSFAVGGETHEYHAERGIADLFDAVTAPYQLLHEPIHIAGEEGPLRLEMVLAYHSWKENVLKCFINHGQALDGGTHEQGLGDALDRLRREFLVPEAPEPHRNGCVGVMAIRYPDVFWQGSTRSKVGNLELRGMVCELVVRLATGWLRGRPDVAAQLQKPQTFPFPENWCA